MRAYLLDTNTLIFHLYDDNTLPVDIVHEIMYSSKDVSRAAEHKDPYDRLLIAQALLDELSIITADEKIFLYRDIYGVDVLPFRKCRTIMNG